MTETATYVVIAANGIDHNSQHYAKDAKVLLDGASAAYHLRNSTVAPIENTSGKTGRKVKEDAA